jgi:hypothetical protein
LDREIARSERVLDPEEAFFRLGNIWTTVAANEAGGVWMHRDDGSEGDAPMSAVVTSGNFVGGALVLWELGIRLLMGNGDAVFYSAREVTHSVEHFEGQRYSLALYSYYSIFAAEAAFRKEGLPLDSEVFLHPQVYPLLDSYSKMCSNIASSNSLAAEEEVIGSRVKKHRIVTTSTL